MEAETDIGSVFAELTALLEDAAALAAEGQRAGVMPAEAAALAAGLKRRLRACVAQLATLGI